MMASVFILVDYNIDIWPTILDMKFLFVCTGNVSRSPAAEAVLRQITGSAHDTRSAGISAFCPRPVSQVDIRWADIVGVMEEDHRTFILERWPEAAPKVWVLGIEDRYHRHDPELIRLLEIKLGELLARLSGDRPPPSL
jgi:protein-tyrosine phosphatase